MATIIMTAAAEGVVPAAVEATRYRRGCGGLGFRDLGSIGRICESSIFSVEAHSLYQSVNQFANMREVDEVHL
jgi:hypothetical protein